MTLNSGDDTQWLYGGTTIHDASSESRTRLAILDPMANEHFQLLIGDLLQASQWNTCGLFRLGQRWILNADIVGVIRNVMERDKFILVEVDDGTGCIRCTIWRQAPSCPDPLSRTTDPECKRLCDQLLRLAHCHNPAQLSSLSEQLTPGQMIHLRGRLKEFRGELKLSANFSRLIADPNELLMHLLHRAQLKRDIYSLPYDPEVMANRLRESEAMFTAKSISSDVCQILFEDGLQTFTKLDVCLNSRLVEAMCSDQCSVLDGNSSSLTVLTEASASSDPGSKELQHMADNLIQSLLQDGWIYPASEPMGRLQAYHSIHKDHVLLEQLYNIIAEANATDETKSGLPVAGALRALRTNCTGDWSKLTPAALNRLLDILESDSRIFQSHPRSYKPA